MIKKSLMLLAVLAGLVVAMTMTDGRNEIIGTGRIAPVPEIRDADGKLLSDRMKGRYVLLNFWSSTDAASRIAANEYTDWVRSHPATGVGLLCVNFDRSDGLFREIVRRDGMDMDSQYRVSGGLAENMRRRYALKDGYFTVLVGPDGRIIARDPTEADLNRIFKI